MKMTINQIAVLDRAKTMVLKGYNLNDSLITSSMIELLQLKMTNGVAHFLYKKKDGSIREVWGTLLQKVVGGVLRKLRREGKIAISRIMSHCPIHGESEKWDTKIFTSIISEIDKQLIN